MAQFFACFTQKLAPARKNQHRLVGTFLQLCFPKGFSFFFSSWIQEANWMVVDWKRFEDVWNLMGFHHHSETYSMCFFDITNFQETYKDDNFSHIYFHSCFLSLVENRDRRMEITLGWPVALPQSMAPLRGKKRGSGFLWWGGKEEGVMVRIFTMRISFEKRVWISVFNQAGIFWVGSGWWGTCSRGVRHVVVDILQTDGIVGRQGCYGKDQNGPARISVGWRLSMAIYW